jgi:hypothetical protein
MEFSGAAAAKATAPLAMKVLRSIANIMAANSRQSKSDTV